MDSWYPVFHCRAISTSWPSSACSNEATLRNSDSFDALRCLTKSTMPPLYLKVVFVTGSVRSSAKRISRPLFKKAMICIRSRMVWARNSVSSKIDAVGPEGDRGAGPRLAGGAVLGGRPGGRDLALDLAALLELGLPVLAVPVDLEQQPRREGVDHRDADAVQAARDLVALARRTCRRRAGWSGRSRPSRPWGSSGGDPPGCPAPSSLDPARRRRPGGLRRSGCSARPWPRRRSCRRPPRPGGADRSDRWSRCTCRAACAPPRAPRGW